MLPVMSQGLSTSSSSCNDPYPSQRHWHLQKISATTNYLDTAMTSFIIIESMCTLEEVATAYLFLDS